MKSVALVALGTGLCVASPAVAQNKPPAALPEKVDSQQAPSPYGLTGDWGGLRTRLHDDGIDISAGYTGELGWNFAGGERHAITESGQFALGVTLDAEKLAGIKGGTFQATATFRQGDDLGKHARLGVLQQVQEIYGRGQTLRLTQFWYEQRLAGDAVAIKAGRATVGEDFSNFSCTFMNLTFCGSQPGNLVGDYWYNWPVSQWMARVRVNHRDFYGQVGVYQVNPRNLDKNFFIGNFKDGTGVLVPVEFGWSPRLGSRGLVGSYKIGGWYSNADANDVFLDVNHDPQVITGLDPLKRNSRYGFWINAWQQLTGTAVNGKPISGVGVFANFTQADRKTSITDNQIAAGIFWKPPFKSLPDDVLAFAVGRTNVNSRFTDGQKIDPAHPEPQTAEYAAELYYSAHPFHGLELRPNVQYIHNPGGRSDANDVGVLGLKFGVTL
jgi:porin